MIDQSCDECFDDFKRDRAKDAHLGRTDFPATRVRASIVLDNHNNTIPRPRPAIDKRDDATPPSSFVQFPGKDGAECVKSTDGAIWPHVKCHICKSYGHWKSACPDAPDDNGKERDRKKKDMKKMKGRTTVASDKTTSAVGR